MSKAEIGFVNYYQCPCGAEWEDSWSCGCNDHCPDCDKEIEPYASDDGSMSPEEIEAARKALTHHDHSMSDLYALWARLGDIPTADQGEIEEDFLSFERGTHREAIWHWFEQQNKHFLVGEVQCGIRRDDDGQQISG